VAYTDTIVNHTGFVATLLEGQNRMALSEPSVKVGEELLNRICGFRLTSVEFVLDYLILGFDGQGALTTMVWPEIIDRDNSVRFGAKDYRDRLCGLIGQPVDRVEISRDETILISFKNDVSLRVPLKNYERSGEKAIFTAPKHHLYVW
jgi:hypothetical protein